MGASQKRHDVLADRRIPRGKGRIVETTNALVMKSSPASDASDLGRCRNTAELLAIARRGMRGNVEFMNLLRDQSQAHRRAAAASTLPRVQAHLSELAEHLEAILGTEPHLGAVPGQAG